MAVVCSNCSAAIPQEARMCPSCQTDAGFPNVRRASKSDEISALATRIHQVDVSAKARGALAALDRFEQAVNCSHAVMNRRLDDLHTWSVSASPFFASFHPQLRDGAIFARDNGWDDQRISAENTVNPIYFDKLQIAALSVDDLGMSYYGKYCVTLREKFIAQRASVFEENPFLFCKRHSVVSGGQPPVGYRATWADRGRLARAKLGHKVQPDTAVDDFSELLMSADRDSDKCDFIEVHIYEKVGRDAIELVSGPNPIDSEERLLWGQTKRKLQSIGIAIHER